MPFKTPHAGATWPCLCAAAGLLWLGGALAAQSPQRSANSEFNAAAIRRPSLPNGQALYTTCAACHGSDGQGVRDGSVPAIAGQHGSVLLKQLTDFRHRQRNDLRMQHFADDHHLAGPQELTDVAAYVASLPRYRPPPMQPPKVGVLQEGARSYFRQCERCHGPLGQGDVHLLRPRLAGQHPAYLAKQMRESAQGLRPGMGPQHQRLLQTLSEAQIDGVAAYLAAVSPELSQQGR
ncbi:MAG: c-type cytochrome [Steroidobacteraceae bacterium]